MSLVLISCNKDEHKDSNEYYCKSNPAIELDWLKEIIEEIEQRNDQYAYYMTATYRDETVFYYGNCDPAANYASFVLNCNRDTLGNINDLSNELIDIRLLWKHDESKCNFINY